MRPILIATLVFLGAATPAVAHAVGGCGCAHVSPRAMAGLNISALSADPDLREIGRSGRLRVGLYNQFASFDRFYANGQRLTDPRERSAVINASVLGIDLGLGNRYSVSLHIPYVLKQQNMGRPPPSPAGLFPKNPAGEDWTEEQITMFQESVVPQLAERSTRGLGDVSLSFAGDVLPDSFRAAGYGLVLSAGLRFPSGSIEEKGGANINMNLPQPFQLGSGHHEFLGGLMLFKSFENYALFAVGHARIPLSRNDFGYVFGKEFSLAAGGVYALPFWDKRIRIGGLLDVSEIEKDNVQIASNFNINQPKGGFRIVPYPLVEDNGDIINSGGRFLYLGPTLEIEAIKNLLISGSFSILAIREANGNESRTNAKGQPAPLGQVLAEGLFQVSVAYTFDSI
jgi:hypothetical protein